MKVLKDFNLKQYNTFGIEARCAEFAEVSSIKDLKDILKHNKKPVVILGGGSNMLFSQDYYDCLFIKNNINGKKLINQNHPIPQSPNPSITQLPNHSLISVGGGENWHSLVLWCLKHNLGGIENLSLIPGTVGAAPIQNIGAYGVELKNIFVKLEAVNMQTLDIQTFTNEDCRFGYRDSVFKNDLKGKYFIIKIYLSLTHQNHTLNTGYGDIQKILTEKNITQPTIKDISHAVTHIRLSKLPNPSVMGNAGSFFKNPEIPKAQFDNLKNQYPNIVGFATEGGIKVAAGWLIEQCGFKGKRYGDIGVHEKQALVLVNYGKGKGLAIKQLAEEIQQSVLDKFGIRLVAEVNVL
jgi:UDP-N-acetylmuramate dehydrogenase